MAESIPKLRDGTVAHLKHFQNNAQMAESVDALVSNTRAFTGMPVRLRLWVPKLFITEELFLFLVYYEEILHRYAVPIPSRGFGIGTGRLLAFYSPETEGQIVTSIFLFPIFTAMLRKAVIFFFLLSAYLLQLGHDIIPHHHHDHDHVTAAHHHDDHHDSDEQEEDDHEDLPELFAHFVHAPYNVAGSTQIDFAKLTPVTLAVLTQHFLLPLPDTVESTTHPPDDDFCLHSAILSTSLPERAPPAC